MDGLDDQLEGAGQDWGYYDVTEYMVTGLEAEIEIGGDLQDVVRNKENREMGEGAGRMVF